MKAGEGDDSMDMSLSELPETVKLLFSWALKSLQTVTVIMELKDVCSLEEKL